MIRDAQSWVSELGLWLGFMGSLIQEAECVVAGVQTAEEELRECLDLRHEDPLTADQFTMLHFSATCLQFQRDPASSRIYVRQPGVDVAPALFDSTGKALYYISSKPNFLHVNPPTGPHPWNIYEMSTMGRWISFFEETGLRPNIDGYDEGDLMEKEKFLKRKKSVV